MQVSTTRLSKSVVLLLLAAALAASGCSTLSPVKQAAPSTSLAEKRASNDDVEVQLLSVAGATAGWLEYQVSVSNRSAIFLHDLHAVVVDKDGREFAAGRVVADIKKPPDMIKGAVVHAGVYTAASLVAVPFLAPVAVGSMMYMRMKGMRKERELIAHFSKESLENKGLAGKDSVRGSFFLPAVESVALRVGYLRGETRAWILIGDDVHAAGVENAEKASREETPGARSISVAEAQTILFDLGYDVGPADGKVGPRTIRAVRRFQEDGGLEVSGTLDSPTLARLGAQR